MTTRTRALALITAVLALLLGGFTATTAHAADETPPRGTVLVAWLITAPAPDIWPGQVLTASLTLDEPTLDAFDSGVLPCGYYQVDLYWTGETTDALLAAGILNGPSDPAEDLAYGAVEGNPWKYLTVETCPTDEPTPTETPTEPAPTPTETAPVVVPTPEPTVAEVGTVARVATPAPALAETGASTGVGILVALILVVTGVTLVAIRRRTPR